jgi:hypothetical protein
VHTLGVRGREPNQATRLKTSEARKTLSQSWGPRLPNSFSDERPSACAAKSRFK